MTLSFIGSLYSSSYFSKTMLDVNPLYSKYFSTTCHIFAPTVSGIGDSALSPRLFIISYTLVSFSTETSPSSLMLYLMPSPSSNSMRILFANTHSG